MHPPALLALLAAALPAASQVHAQAPVEVELAASSLRAGERERLEAALGPLAGLPLYRVELSLEPQRRQVSGRVSITFTARRTLAEVALRLTPGAAHPGAVALSELEVNGAQSAFARPEPTLRTVALEPPVAAGAPVTLAFRISARVPQLEEAPALDEAPERRQGGDRGAFSASADVLSLVGLVPMLAPFQPGTGELMEGPAGVGAPASFAPSNFLLAATVPAGWRVLAPGLLMGEVPERRTGRVRHSYALAGARGLPVLAVRGYVLARRQVGEVAVEAWHRPSDGAGGKQALEHAAGVAEVLEARLGPLPYRTLRVVEASLEAGAEGMAFSGLVTVAQALHAGEERGLELAVARGLAHQYAGLLVGSDPVGEPVADEALAQHLALLAMEWRHGADVARELEVAQLRTAYQLHRLLGGPDAAANRPTWAFDSEAEYAALVAGKAPLKFSAWRALLGDEAWLATLRAYVQEQRYRWVTARTLLELAQRRAPDSADALAESERRWWDQSHGDEDLGVEPGGEEQDPRWVR